MLFLLFFCVLFFIAIAGASDQPMRVNCTLCADGTQPNDPTGKFRAGEETITCLEAHNRGALLLTPGNCSIFQDYGRDICSCGRTRPISSDCKLCEDGNKLPNALWEGLPGESCIEVEADARRAPMDRCFIYQGTIGVYCRCNNPNSSAEICRLCGDYDLPRPLQTISVAPDTNKSCGELEFEINIEDGNCDTARTLYADCCENLVIPTAAPTPTSVGTDSALISWPILLVMTTVIVLSSRV